MLYSGNILSEKTINTKEIILSTLGILLDKLDNDRSIYKKVLTDGDYDFYVEYFINGLKIFTKTNARLSDERTKVLFELVLTTCERISDELINTEKDKRYPKDNTLNILIENLLTFYFFSSQPKQNKKYIKIEDLLTSLASIRYFITDEVFMNIFTRLFKMMKFLISSNYQHTKQDINSFENISIRVNKGGVHHTNDNYSDSMNRYPTNKNKNMKWWYELLIMQIVTLRPLNKKIFDFISHRMNRLCVVDEGQTDIWCSSICSMSKILKLYKKNRLFDIEAKRNLCIDLGFNRIKQFTNYYEIFQIWIFLLGLKPIVTTKSLDFQQKVTNSSFSSNSQRDKIISNIHLHNMDIYINKKLNMVIRNFLIKEEDIFFYDHVQLIFNNFVIEKDSQQQLQQAQKSMISNNSNGNIQSKIGDQNKITNEKYLLESTIKKKEGLFSNDKKSGMGLKDEGSMSPTKNQTNTVKVEIFEKEIQKLVLMIQIACFTEDGQLGLDLIYNKLNNLTQMVIENTNSNLNNHFNCLTEFLGSFLKNICLFFNIFYGVSKDSIILLDQVIIFVWRTINLLKPDIFLSKSFVKKYLGFFDMIFLIDLNSDIRVKSTLILEQFIDKCNQKNSSYKDKLSWRIILMHLNGHNTSHILNKLNLVINDNKKKVISPKHSLQQNTYHNLPSNNNSNNKKRLSSDDMVHTSRNLSKKKKFLYKRLNEYKTIDLDLIQKKLISDLKLLKTDDDLSDGNITESIRRIWFLFTFLHNHSFFDIEEQDLITIYNKYNTTPNKNDNKKDIVESKNKDKKDLKKYLSFIQNNQVLDELLMSNTFYLLTKLFSLDVITINFIHNFQWSILINNQALVNLVSIFLRKKYAPHREQLQYELNLFNTIISKSVVFRKHWCYFTKRGACIIPLHCFKKSSRDKYRSNSYLISSTIIPSKMTSKKNSRKDQHKVVKSDKKSNIYGFDSGTGVQSQQPNINFFDTFEEVVNNCKDWPDFDNSEYLLLNNEFGSSLWELRPQTLKVPYFKEMQDQEDEILEQCKLNPKLPSPNTKGQIVNNFDELFETQEILEKNENTYTRPRARTFSQISNYKENEESELLFNNSESRFFVHSISSRKARTTLDQILKPNQDNQLLIPIIYQNDDIVIKSNSKNDSDLDQFEDLIQYELQYSIDQCKYPNQIFEEFITHLGLYINRATLDTWKLYCIAQQEISQQIILYDNGISGQLAFQQFNYNVEDMKNKLKEELGKYKVKNEDQLNDSKHFQDHKRNAKMYEFCEDDSRHVIVEDENESRKVLSIPKEQTKKNVDCGIPNKFFFGFLKDLGLLFHMN